MNYDSLIETLICRFGRNNSHLLSNPKYLPCCHNTVCDQCILKACGEYSSVFKCAICKEHIKISIKNEECVLEPNMQAQQDLEKYTIDINHYLLRKLDSSINHVEERLDSSEEYLEKRNNFIKNEIHSQVKALKSQLDDYEQELQRKLSISCANAVTNIDSLKHVHGPELAEVKHSLDILKSNAFSYTNGITKSSKENANFKEEAYLNTLPQKNSINKCLNYMTDLTKLNESVSGYIDSIKFYPNIESVNESLIGTLTAVTKINLEEQFKAVRTQWEITSLASVKNEYKKMPISPRNMCELDGQSMLFTDNHTKQIIQLKLETGDYVQSTNLKGALKSPDGICINHKKGLIYVADSDLGVVFKLDLNFNIIRQFGSRDLKWPRGITYDHEASSPNCLYVCDYLNRRVAIFNDQDQLRDEIVLSAKDKLVPNYNTINNGTYETSEIEDELKFCPVNVLVKGQSIYVTDDWSSSNCIRVFDKTTKELIRNIGHLQAWNPLGIAIDDNDNIFTLAKLFYDTGTTQLFCFSKKGKLLYRTNLNISDNGSMSDFMIDRNTDKSRATIVACGECKIHFFNFE